MLTGRRPFEGPGVEDYREQHLHEVAPTIPTEAGVAATVADCLVKPAQARPSAARLLERLERFGTRTTSSAQERLGEVNLRIASEKAAASAGAERQRTETERRQELFESAKVSLARVLAELQQGAIEAAPEVAPNGEATWPIRLGNAKLSRSEPQPVTPTVWEHYVPAFDVIASAKMEITIPEDQWGYVGRGCSFWYCDAVREGEYRWYEVAFMTSGFSRRRTKGSPIPLDPGPDSGVAVSNVMGSWQVAWPFTPIDQGDHGEFIERWLGWFADAAGCRLRHPSNMPERRVEGSYRKK
jgi:hypothetical protein